MADDPTILSVLAGLQTTVEASRTETTRAIDALRSDLSGRMEQMITRREHEAEVRRQDAETAHVRQALADHERTASARLDDIEGQYGTVLRRIADADEKREAARAAAEERRKADRRWLIGIILTAVSVASGLTGVLVNAIGG